jgi:hypothetical protein
VQSSQVEEGQKCSFSCINTTAPNLRAVMVNPNRFYTYAYLREDRTPYYVGKGNNRRAYQKHNGFYPPKDKSRILILKNNLTEEEAFKHEIYMIAVFGRKDLGTGILLNKTNGGEGNSGTIFTQKRRENIRKSKLGKSSSLKGKTYKEMHGDSYLKRVERMREINTGKILSKETKQKISNSKKGTIVWNKGISIESKYVYQLKNPDGKVIFTKSMRNFCKENGLNLTCMFRLINGKQKQHKGWTFLAKQDIIDSIIAIS